jgi:hypothetical protein
VDHAPINGTSVRFLRRDSSAPRSFRLGNQCSVEHLVHPKHSAKVRVVLGCLEALTILSHAALSRPRLLHKKCECATDIIEAAVARLLAERESYIWCPCVPIEPSNHTFSIPYCSQCHTHSHAFQQYASSTLLDLYNKAFRQLNIPQYGSYHHSV